MMCVQFLILMNNLVDYTVSKINNFCLVLATEKEMMKILLIIIFPFTTKIVLGLKPSPGCGAGRRLGIESTQA